jgi:hypothetical protein
MMSVSAVHKHSMSLLFVFERDILKHRYECLHEKHIYCVFSNIDSIEQFLRKNILKKSRSSKISEGG